MLLVGVFIARFIAPAGMSDWLTTLLVYLLIFLLPFIMIALSLTVFRRTLFHCEQIHLYANGFVSIDPRGRRQGARWDQLFDFRRGAHQNDARFGRLRWDIIRATIADPRSRQSSSLKVTPHLPDSVEICARIERSYTDFWLPRFREQFAAGEVLDFDALLLHQDWLGKTTPGRRRFSAALPHSFSPPISEPSVAPGMARGLITQVNETTQIEWLRRNEIKSIRVDDRFFLIRTIEPVRRDKQGRADRLWFQLDTLGLRDAAILKEILPEFTAKLTTLY
jgi:hypothetical protein